jgi:predicted nucleic acid-binding protein
MIPDASLVVPFLIEGDRTSIARSILASPRIFKAPDILVAEVGNALWLYERAASKRTEASGALLERIRESIDLIPCTELLEDAFAIALEIDHPMYDTFYVALARRDAVPMVTFDKRLLRKLAGTPYAGLAIAASDFNDGAN